MRRPTRGTGSTVRSTNLSDRGDGGAELSHARPGVFEQPGEEPARAPGAQPGESGWREEELREWLAAHLRAWERHRVTFGVTLPSFASGAVEEHVRVFRAGCIDVGSGGLPPPAAMRHCAGEVTQGFAFTVMLSDDTLVYRFLYGHPDRGRRGELNPGFLDPGPLRERVCVALDTLDGMLDTVVLQMQPVYRTEELRAPEFVGRLDRFLGGLPRACRYAVDLRTPAFNVPEYRACLRDHGVAHLLHHEPRLLHPWPETPSLIDQLLTPGILSAPCCPVLVHAGPEQNHNRDDEALMLGIHELIRACGDEGVALTVLMSHGRDTLPVLTRLLHSLDGELARRSPLRRRAA